ncbi:MAG: peptide chain release factor N(5)-glutamine methyltransferase [Verrucomicrobiota bacterium]
MPTILDTLRKGTEYLEKYEIEDARLNMEHLIAHTLRIERMQLYLDFDRPLDEVDLEKLRDLTKRRSRGEPLQHLLGTVEFCDLEFVTDPRALVPRPETEELCTALLKSPPGPSSRVLDMGCGSGVIGLALAHHWRDLETEFVLCDHSSAALSLAQENATLLHLNERVKFLESDLFESISGDFDLIVANLPYIPRNEETDLSREVLHDPAEALYGGNSGLELIARFLRVAPSYLRAQGKVALEHGIHQSESIWKLAEESGFDTIESRKDLSGIERFLFATKSN